MKKFSFHLLMFFQYIWKNMKEFERLIFNTNNMKEYERRFENVNTKDILLFFREMKIIPKLKKD